MLVPIDDALCGEVLCPNRSSFIVTIKPFGRGSFEDCHVETFGREMQYLGEIFPSPVNRFVLEVIPEGPVTKHLKHRMVVGIMAHLFEVIMLTADAQTLLRVRYTAMLDLGITEYNILELVHPCIGEHQGGVALDHHRSRGYDRMALTLEERLI